MAQPLEFLCVFEDVGRPQIFHTCICFVPKTDSLLLIWKWWMLTVLNQKKQILGTRCFWKCSVGKSNGCGNYSFFSFSKVISRLLKNKSVSMHCFFWTISLCMSVYNWEWAAIKSYGVLYGLPGEIFPAVQNLKWHPWWEISRGVAAFVCCSQSSSKSCNLKH